MEKKGIETIRKQVEYYLSDENLKQDEFFHSQIKTSQDRYLGLHLIMKCKKIKSLNVKNEQQLVEAIKASDILELNENNTGVRRKDNPELPVLEKSTKKAKLNDSSAHTVNNASEPTENQEETKNNDSDNNGSENPFDNFEPLVFDVTCEKEGVANWKLIQEDLLRTYNLHVPYARFAKVEGNFVLNQSRVPQETVDNLEKTGLKIGDAIINVKLAKGDSLQRFWDHHGHHFNTIIERTKQDFGANRAKQEDKKKKKKVGEF